jgi:hypothetical protein
MTEPRKPTNPLLRKDTSPYSPEAGTDAARQYLQDHCDRLNLLAWCRNQWSVVKHGERWTVTRETHGHAA